MNILDACCYVGHLIPMYIFFNNFTKNAKVVHESCVAECA